MNNDTQLTIELDASKLTGRSDSELIISTNNLEIGTYDLIIDHSIFDSKRFNNAIVVKNFTDQLLEWSADAIKLLS